MARDHLACSAEVACSHVSGLFTQSGGTAGPDGVREPSPHHSNGIDVPMKRQVWLGCVGSTDCAITRHCSLASSRTWLSGLSRRGAPLRHLSAKLLSDRNSSEWEPSMGEVTTIGLDLAKHVFQVHGVDAEGATVLRKQLRRAQVLAFFSRLPPCLVGLEACATAHYWGRELRALGHEVRLMPAQYVKAYIKRNKHDAADAEA